MSVCNTGGWIWEYALVRVCDQESKGLKVCLLGFCRGFKSGESRVSKAVGQGFRLLECRQMGLAYNGHRLEVQGMEVEVVFVV